ncbi:MAG: hybrid sensor histidine kinase/response regulator [Gammaproteobacteria bacterium]|nr:hybrid sensor histidine kinase/response regulator [Gammaproteobacteria bacterium]MDH5799823.1 hybrid sensor histidine kinase/response regulator [Gammaproteobacteria bacterium]
MHLIDPDSKPKVLIIDDTPDNIDLVEQVLEDHYQTLSAPNGHEGLKIAQKQAPDLVLLDVMMPDLDGYEVLQQLQKSVLTRDIPVIFLTARYKDTDRIVKGLKLGAFDYITKPFEDDILLARVGVATRIKKAEDEIRKQKEELIAANKAVTEATRAKSRFLANMSHEFRTPLNSIMGFLSIVKEGMAGPINDEQSKSLNIAYESSKHLLQLINDILDLAKIEANKVTVIKESFSLDTLFSELSDMFKIQAHSKGIAFDTQIDTPELMLYTDRTKLQQVLINLIGNALKFTSRGYIKVACVNLNDKLRIDVIDTGKGVSERDLKIIFNAFEQSEEDKRQHQDGVGLGLAISKRHIEILGGYLSAQGSPGEGSTFSFTLPIEMPEEYKPTQQKQLDPTT